MLVSPPFRQLQHIMRIKHKVRSALSLAALTCTFGVALSSAAQAQQYITQNVCNMVNGGAIIRTTVFQPFIGSGTGLAASTFFGATRSLDTTTNTTTCFIPVANVGSNTLMGSLNQAIATSALISGANRSIVTIDYTIGASGPNATFDGAVSNSRRFVLMADGFMADGTTPQNRLPPSGPGPALVVQNANVFLRGNGEVRGDIVFSGAGSSVEVNFNEASPSTYEDYSIVVNGNIDASGATSSVELGMMHSTLNGNFTASDFDDVGVMGRGAIINGFVAAGEGNNDFTVRDDARILAGITAGDGNNTLLIQDSATVSGGITAGDGNNSVTLRGDSIIAGDVVFGDGSDTVILEENTDISGVSVFNGGDGLLATDGFVDRIIFDNASHSSAQNIDGSRLLEWEEVHFVNGSTVNLSGALEVGDASDTSTGIFVSSGARLNFLSNPVITGNIHNSSLVSAQDGNAGSILTVNGNYLGTGQLLVDADLSNGSADRLVISGDVDGASITTIVVNNISAGASGGDVLIVSVDGNLSETNFQLDGGSITSGIWVYNLVTDPNAVLLKAQANSIGAVYETAPSVLLSGFTSLPTLEQRVGQRQWVLRGDNAVDGVWLRLHGEHARVEPAVSDSVARWNSNSFGLQFGADIVAAESDAGFWVLGVTGQYGTVNAGITNALGAGNISASGYGLGATATWHGYAGTYLDLQGQANWISANYDTAAHGVLASSRNATAYALSAELGHRVALDDNRALVPQAQLSWGQVSGGSFTDSQGNDVNLGTNSRTIGRIGLAYEYRPDGVTSGQNGSDEQMVYGIANILHDFSSPTSVDVAGTALQSRGERTWAEIGLGGSVEVAPNAMLYGQASYRPALGGGGSNNSLNGTVGLRLQW